jgi:hypothetical protein
MSGVGRKPGTSGGPAIDRRGGVPTLRNARRKFANFLLRPSRPVDPGLSPDDGEGASALAGLDDTARRTALNSLEEELADQMDDAANRGVSERATEDLLLTAAIVRWLREGAELPGQGAIEMMEIHAAIFNGARHEEERELQRAFESVLTALVEAQAEAISAGRWRGRQIDVESAEAWDRRQFGANLDELRTSRDLTIGELASRADIDALTVVGLIHGTEDPGSTEIRRLAGALDVQPGSLFPDPEGAAARVAADAAAVEDEPEGGKRNG